MKEKNESNGMKGGLLLKISAMSSVLLLIAITILAYMGVRTSRISSFETAIMMGTSKIKGDMVSFNDNLVQEYGKISLINGELVSKDGKPIKNDYKIVDKISSTHGVQVTIFMRENEDFRRITTSIVDGSGKRAVDTFLGTGSPAYQPVRSGNDYYGNANILGKNYLTAYRPFFGDNSREAIGILFIGIEMSPIENYVIKTRNQNLVTVVIEALIILFISILVTIVSCRRILIKPLQSVMVMLHGLRDGDLTQSIEVKGNDEITDLSKTFNETVLHLRDLLGAIQSKINALTNTGYELSVNMEKTSESVDEISSNFDEIKKLESKQKKGSEEVNRALDDIKTSINIQNNLIDEQTSSVNTSSSAIEEMTASINSVNKSLTENKKHVDNLTEASEYGKTALQTVVGLIQEIARDSEGLLEINSVMKNIASQTNLLSMNAAIEAAHAGEVGKGFAVVADEIRKLAETSSQQSKTTTSMLKKIKSSIDSITKSSDDVLNRFGAIDTGVKTVSTHELNIRNAMEEQEAGGRQILDSITRLKEITVSVQKGSGDMSQSGSDLTRETDNFIKISNESLSGMNEMINGALNEIKKAMTNVDEMNKENSKNFEDLKSETEKFNTSTGNEKKKILAIDDDRTHLEMTQSFLGAIYDVTTVKSCKEALSLLYEGLAPNLILLDLMMPETDGFDTYDRIKGLSNLNHVPIAIFTSSSDPVDKNRAMKIGAADYIRKPCKKSELIERIGNILGKPRVQS